MFFQESFSDEDGESVTSSQMSDFGSPCPPTPVTPSTPTAVESTSDLRNTPSSETEYKGVGELHTWFMCDSKYVQFSFTSYMQCAEFDNFKFLWEVKIVPEIVC